MSHALAHPVRSLSRPVLHPVSHPVPHPVPHPVLRPASRPPIFVVRGRPGPTDRPALPPGSPESWGAITANTVLDSAPYPFPVFPAYR